jgi:acetoin:2,6-dichlorophenolindophenol oxidoreductase subunit beta
MAKKYLIQAMNEALAEEMERDPKVIMFGEDIEIGGVTGDARGLLERFGPTRIRNTPICETVMTGMAVGAAAAGYRVVCHMMYGNFLYTGMDALANQAAKLRYMTGGQITLPIVYLGLIGAGRSSAAQHSDSMHPMFMNLGGIKVVLPSTPADAKGLLKSAIRDNNPVLFLQAAGRGGESGEVPEGDILVPLSQAVVKRPGTDLTLVAIGSMVRPSMQAAEAVAKEGIDVEVIDPRTVFPLDETSILSSIEKTGKLVVVDEARNTCSAASHIAAIAAERAFHMLKAPILRVTMPDLAVPYSPVLEKSLLPNANSIAAKMREAMANSGNRRQ